MARLRPFDERKVEFKESNLGRVLLFCEGLTEKNYFKYFAEIIDGNRNKYSRIKIIPFCAGGNVRTVLNFAEA